MIPAVELFYGLLLSSLSSSVSSSYLSTIITQAIANSVASALYINPSSKQYYDNITAVKNVPTVRVANSETITATKRVAIPLSTALSNRSQTSHIFPNHRTGNLLSIGQLCDDSCFALFRKDTPQVFKHGQQVLTGYRNHTNGLWDVTIIPTTIENTTSNTPIVPFRHPQKKSIIRQAKKNTTCQNTYMPAPSAQIHQHCSEQ